MIGSTLHNLGLSVLLCVKLSLPSAVTRVPAVSQFTLLERTFVVCMDEGSPKMELKPTAANKCFEGVQKIFSHQSTTLGCTMNFAIYLPPQADDGKVPVIYWLSGLSCTETNFVQKAGAQRIAAKYGVAIVCPDTSPRGVKIPGEDDSWDFGSGAGFYVNATQEPWKKHYQMYSYVTQELPEIINKNFPVQLDQQSIMGHSMGGHGALICALKNPGKYRAVSAFAPICNPSAVPWGQKAFEGYLGSQTNETGENVWAEWDATILVEKYSGPPIEILIDQGKDDQYAHQLCPDTFVEACQRAKMPVILHKRDGYDHSYFFIATYIENHIKHHLQYLKGMVE